MPAYVNNYTVGRGEIYFDRFSSEEVNRQVGERYFGNTPGFSLNISAEMLEHFSSDYGMKEKDDSAVMSLSYNGSLTVDDISDENLAMFFGGTASKLQIGPLTGVTSTLTQVAKGAWHQIGATDANLTGVRNVTTVSVTKGATPLVLGTDYELDAKLGRIYIMASSSVLTSGDNLTVTYSAASQTRSRIVSDSYGIFGRLRYIAKNVQGTQRDFFMPKVQLTPNGDFNFKGDGWQEIGFNIEVLKLNKDTPILIIDGRPA